jgi:uncharacterized NAD(P)/FAD-binding protein YdhS
VQTTETRGDHGLAVAVIGGGASGTLAVVHLLRRAAAEQVPLRVVLLDRLGRHGLGQAYSTSHPDHLLNSPASRMSAVPDDPGHLVRWARAAGVEHDGFLPRWAYGRYLRDLLADAQDRARQLARVSQLTSDVVSIAAAGPRRPLRLRLATGGGIDADIAILATGSPRRSPAFPVPPGPQYVADPWAPGALEHIGHGRPVVVMGTGLTMVDVALAITRSSPGTVVHAVSRHGLLPRVHVAAAPAAEMNVLSPISSPPPDSGLAPLLRYVRKYIEQYPGCWQDAVDALRPQVPLLWQRLTPADQRLFLRYVARYWEVHRHRMPPATAAKIAELRAAGRLRLIRGRVSAAAPEGYGVRVSIEQGSIEQGSAGFDLSAGWLVDATGPAADVTATPDPLVRSLLSSGLARPGPHRLGIDADASGAILDVFGRPSAEIRTLGPPLRGVCYETTAIPEIRDQAAALAGRLIAAARSRATAGHAA